MLNLQYAEMKLYFSWLGFKSKDMCLDELRDSGYECNKQCYQMRASVSFKRSDNSNKHVHFILYERF